MRLLFPGLLLATTVALAATFLSEHYGAPMVLMALLLGMAFHVLAEDETSPCRPGIEFASRHLLRWGVALLGLGITLNDIADIGLQVVLMVCAGVSITLMAGILGGWLLGRGLNFGLLTGGAVAICGASAALAIASLLPREKSLERDTVFVVVTVTTLGTVAMILYPIVASWLSLSERATGIFLGATIHDVAQVVGAGYSVSDHVGQTATVIKLLRVTMLLPLVIGLSLSLHRTSAAKNPRPQSLPYFVAAFAVCVLAGSVHLVPEEARTLLLAVSRGFLVTAIAALGAKTALGKLAAVGPSAVIFMGCLTILLAVFVLTTIQLTSL